jgi:hypothetical protein
MAKRREVKEMISRLLRLARPLAFLLGAALSLLAIYSYAATAQMVIRDPALVLPDAPQWTAAQLESALTGRFENNLVRPGSIVVIIAGIILAVIGGWPIFAVLQGGAANWLLVSNLLLLSIIAEIVFIFVLRGKVYEKVQQDAVARDGITPELRATFQDPVVRWAHLWEEISVILIIYLMIAKPFKIGWE